MSCHYCENPLKYDLLPARMMTSREWREDGPPMTDAYGKVIVINGKTFPASREHEVQKLTHPELIHVTGYNGILCKNERQLS